MKKRKKLNKPKECQIYGIYDFKKKKMIFVSLDLDQVELEYDLGDYTSDHEIVTLHVGLF